MLKDHKVAFAESCTGGALSARVVAQAGASGYFLGSIVAYSDEWKVKFLGVRKKTLAKYGAVSGEVVKEMVEGLFVRTEATLAVAVSGIAGPTGGLPDKPVGTVWIGVGRRAGGIEVKCLHIKGDRAAVIAGTVEAVMAWITS